MRRAQAVMDEIRDQLLSDGWNLCDGFEFLDSAEFLARLADTIQETRL